MVAVIDHDHPALSRQLLTDLIPLAQRRAGEPVDQEDRSLAFGTGLAHQELLIPYIHGPTLQTPGMFLGPFEDRFDVRAQESPESPASQQASQPLHLLKSPLANESSVTGWPPTRCSSTMRSSFSSSRPAYQVPSG